MFQALEGALLIKNPVFKQMLFPVCSRKFYSRVLTIFYQRVYSCSITYLGCGEEAQQPCSAQLGTQAAPLGAIQHQPGHNTAGGFNAAMHSSRRHRCAP